MIQLPLKICITKLSGGLGVAPKAPWEGRSAAIGRELLRLVMHLGQTPLLAKFDRHLLWLLQP